MAVMGIAADGVVAAAIVSFLGGELTASGQAAPFRFALVCGTVALLAALTIWQRRQRPGAATP